LTLDVVKISNVTSDHTTQHNWTSVDWDRVPHSILINVSAWSIVDLPDNVLTNKASLLLWVCCCRGGPPTVWHNGVLARLQQMAQTRNRQMDGQTGC